MYPNKFTSMVCAAICLLVVMSNSRRNGAEGAFYGYSPLTLFEETNQEGESFFRRVGSECVELPARWQRRASSVNSHGSCIMLCRYPYCRGCVRIQPNSPGQEDLEEINFDEQIISVRSCEGQDYLY